MMVKPVQPVGLGSLVGFVREICFRVRWLMCKVCVCVAVYFVFVAVLWLMCKVCVCVAVYFVFVAVPKAGLV